MKNNQFKRNTAPKRVKALSTPFARTPAVTVQPIPVQLAALAILAVAK